MGCGSMGLLGAAGINAGKAGSKIHHATTKKLGGRQSASAVASTNEFPAGSSSTSSRSRHSAASLASASSISPSSALRQIVCRVRSGWRRQAAWCGAPRSRACRSRFGYDLESYSQNFDDGFFRDYD